MAPFNALLDPGTLLYFGIFFMIGVAFGAVLEIAGLGDSRRLAAQFYMRDMTVLKVMFTAIIVAAVLIHLASAFGLLDLSRVWVNPTYLTSGIAGGLVMGVGFIIGGFCPGTSLVAAATLKLDGVFFVGGVLSGVFLFGRTVGGFQDFFHAGFHGRFTLADWLHLPAGVVVVLVVLMALAMFYGAEVSETVFGKRRSWREVHLLPQRPAALAGVLVLLAAAASVALHGQPGVQDRWNWIAPEGEKQIAERDIYVDPAEVLDLRRDLAVRVRIFEVRSETDYNLFHLQGSERMLPEMATDPGFARGLLSADDRTVFFLASNDEAAATTAWKSLRAQGVLNLYVISGGINGWLDRFPQDDEIAELRTGDPTHREDTLRYRFFYAVGDRIPGAHPDLARKEFVPGRGYVAESEHASGKDEPAYEKKVKLQRKVVAKGGCG